MALHLYYTPSVAPHLPSILKPLVQRHFQFKLKDSFRIFVPNSECRQDIETILLSEEKAGGILIGKSILTPPAFLQEILLHHPQPHPRATLYQQRKILAIVLRCERPELSLDPAGLQRCLYELERLASLSALTGSRGIKKPWATLDEAFQNALSEKFRVWSARKSAEEALKVLEKVKIPELKNLEEIYWLGFNLPEEISLALLETFLKNYPQIHHHLFLPPLEKMMDRNLLLERPIKKIEQWAERPIQRLKTLPPKVRQISYATPIHEGRNILEKIQTLRGSGRILTPSSGPMEEILRNLFAEENIPFEAPASLVNEGSLALFPLLDSLQTENPAEEISWNQFLEFLLPPLQNLKKELAARQEGYSLRYLDWVARTLQEWTQAEAILAENHPSAHWVEQLRQEVLHLSLPSPSPSPSTYPVRRIERAGLRRSEALFIAGLNEGYYPPSSLPFLLAEDFQDSLAPHQKMMALEQSYYLAEKEVTLSFSEFSLSGRVQQPAPMITELEHHLLTQPHQELPLFYTPRHPFFGENIRRERQRSLAGELNPDAGNLSSLKLQNWILKRVQSRPLSASYLDDYAKCPWRFFARWHLHLEEKRKETFEIEPIRRGNFLHTLLEKIFSRLIEKYFAQHQVPPPSVLPEVLETCFSELAQALQTEENFKDFPPVVLREQLERVKVQVEGLIEKESKNWQDAEEILWPKFLEWRFGYPGTPAVFYPLGEKTSIPLAGAIDRIDVDPINKKFLVLDYKSSQTSKLSSQIRETRSFQLFIYLYAVAQALLKDHHPLGGLYWDLKDQKKNQGMVLVEEFQKHTPKSLRGDSFFQEEQFWSLYSRIQGTLEGVLRKILRGDYSLSPQDCLGRRCEFFEICRYENKSE